MLLLGGRVTAVPGALSPTIEDAPRLPKQLTDARLLGQFCTRDGLAAPAAPKLLYEAHPAW